MPAILIALFLFAIMASSFSPTEFILKEGFVPNTTTAIAEEEAVLIPIYGPPDRLANYFASFIQFKLAAGDMS